MEHDSTRNTSKPKQPSLKWVKDLKKAAEVAKDALYLVSENIYLDEDYQKEPNFSRDPFYELIYKGELPESAVDCCHVIGMCIRYDAPKALEIFLTNNKISIPKLCISMSSLMVNITMTSSVCKVLSKYLLPNLRVLVLQRCIFTNQALDQFCNGLENNAKLTKLELDSCRLTSNQTSILFASLIKKDRPALQVLRLNSNAIDKDGFEYLMDNIKKFSNLTDLDLSNNSAPSKSFESVYKYIGKNSSLRKLDLSGNRFRSSSLIKNLFKSLLRNTTLEVLRLASANVTDAEVIELRKLLESNKTLKKLDISGHQLSAESLCQVLDTISNANSLTSLDISSNAADESRALTQPEVESVANLIAGASNFKRIGLRFCALNDKKCSSILSSLAIRSEPMECLRLDGNQIRELDKDNVVNACSLNELSLSSNKLSAKTLKNLEKHLREGRCSLKSLYLSNCGIGILGDDAETAIASLIGAAPGLHTLDLTFNKFSIVSCRLFSEALIQNSGLMSIRFHGQHLRDKFFADLLVPTLQSHESMIDFDPVLLSLAQRSDAEAALRSMKGNLKYGSDALKAYVFGVCERFEKSPTINSVGKVLARLLLEDYRARLPVPRYKILAMEKLASISASIRGEPTSPLYESKKDPEPPVDNAPQCSLM